MNNIIDTPTHTLQIYKNGLCYCLFNKIERKYVFFEDEAAGEFWNEYNRVCEFNTSYAEMLRRLWDIYSEVAQPCRM